MDSRIEASGPRRDSSAVDYGGWFVWFLVGVGILIWLAHRKGRSQVPLLAPVQAAMPPLVSPWRPLP